MNKSVAARNAIWNWMGMGTQMLVGFLILPFLIRKLGASSYGLWLIIGSLSGYFGMLDFGLSGSVARNVAFYKAKNDIQSVNGLLNTAVVYLFSASVLAMVITTGVAIIFFHVIPNIPFEQHAEVRLAIILVGLNLAITLPLNAFDGILWAYQRFDLQNAVDIPAVLLRGLLTYVFISGSRDLVILAIITLSTSLIALLCKVLLTFCIERRLCLSVRFVSSNWAKILFGYGVWYFLLSLTRSVAPQVSLLLVGMRLGTEQVTLYSVATRLTAYANSFLIAGTQVMTPAATALHANEETGEQRTLFLEGGKLCLILAAFFLSLFLFLGPALLRLWTGLQGAYSLLLILAFGELLPMSQWVSYSIVLAKGRHKALAWATVIEISCAAVGLFFVARPFGLLGVCAVLAICGGLCRGLFQCLYACRLVEVSPRYYLTQAILPTVFAATGPAILLGLATRWFVPSTWATLVTYTIAYSLCYFGFTLTMILGFERLRFVRDQIAARRY